MEAITFGALNRVYFMEAITIGALCRGLLQGGNSIWCSLQRCTPWMQLSLVLFEEVYSITQAITFGALNRVYFMEAITYHLVLFIEVYSKEAILFVALRRVLIHGGNNLCCPSQRFTPWSQLLLVLFLEVYSMEAMTFGALHRVLLYNIGNLPLVLFLEVYSMEAITFGALHRVLLYNIGNYLWCSLQRFTPWRQLPLVLFLEVYSIEAITFGSLCRGLLHGVNYFCCSLQRFTPWS